jgi:septum site-determining protein MinD
MGESVLITSGKGGCGKSTFAVNCGAAMALNGKKVLLVDGDAGLRALDLMLSVSDKVVYDLADVLAGRCEPIRAIVQTDIKDLHILPAPLSATDVMFEPGGMKRLCRGLANYYDYVLIDSSAGIGSSMATSAAAADRAIIVATPDPVSIRDADRVAAVVIKHGVTDIRLVINGIKPKLIRKKVIYGLDRAIDAAAIQLIGIVPEDEQVTVAAFRGVPVVTMGKSGAAMAFCNIARRIAGENVPLMKL